MTTVALVGNPNSGKTTIFNALTGTRQRVGNWPGVTVERKTGHYHHGNVDVQVVDLPGTYSLDPVSHALDEQITRQFLGSDLPDVLLNVVDASSLARGLALSVELLASGHPVVIALNMMDVADRHGLHIDTYELSRALGCPVIPTVASKEDGIGALRDAVQSARAREDSSSFPTFDSTTERFAFVDQLLTRGVRSTPVRRSLTDALDRIVLNRYLAFPIFLAVMYLMFLIAINVGSAFIDLFDGVGNVLFVEGPRQAFQSVGLPDWLTAILADGVGGGIALVGTFIPVIGCLFLVLSFLEDSGYMGRAAFIIDRLMGRLGLPGKSFVPLMVGFGCNVPAVMATRTLDNQRDRILTTIMAPYMSCGARLTVYALFAAAFFPRNGQNVVFALYLIGIAVAVISAAAVRRYLIVDSRSHFLLELPTYHMPTFKGLLLQSWQRLRGFVVRAGKAIVTVVVVLNVVNSVGTDGSFGNQNSEKSALAALGRTITPLLHPMGVQDDNWPAAVGIFTGIFAKEVVVGTLDALYTPAGSAPPVDLTSTLQAAVNSVPENLAALGDQLLDPLGIGLAQHDDVTDAASDQGVQITTIRAMRSLFAGELGAFSYLLFILLYMPCVATVGVIFKEIGGFWAMFSVTWSVVVAYSAAVLCYQLGHLAETPLESLAWSAGVTAAAVLAFAMLVRLGRLRESRLVPLTSLD